ncbi:hypothetical protein CR513_50298, partial [Mucuna pruriens]
MKRIFHYLIGTNNLSFFYKKNQDFKLDLVLYHELARSKIPQYLLLKLNMYLLSIFVHNFFGYNINWKTKF